MSADKHAAHAHAGHRHGHGHPHAAADDGQPTGAQGAASTAHATNTRTSTALPSKTMVPPIIEVLKETL